MSTTSWTLAEPRAVVRAELFKLSRRPAVWVLLATVVVLNQIFGYLVPYLSFRSGGSDFTDGAPVQAVLDGTLPDQLVGNTIGAFPVFAGALALVLGALVLGGEYGWGTVKTMLTQRPGRGSVVAGQLVALAVAVLLGVLVLFVLGAVTSAGIAAAESAALVWPPVSELLTGVAAGWLILLVWALLGAALGVGLRGVAVPIGLGVVWVLGVENLLSAMAGSVLSALEPVRDLLPGVNAGSLVFGVSPGWVAEPPPGVTASVSEPRALLTLGCYLVGAAVVAAWVSRRRDVA